MKIFKQQYGICLNIYIYISNAMYHLKTKCVVFVHIKE